MDEYKNELRETTTSFALAVSDACEEIKGCGAYVNQVIRSSSSIGANLFEAKYAQSRADFIHKLEIALKECSETEYWLELLYRKEKLTEVQFKTLNNTRGTIQRKLIASITTAKKNSK
ncbi:MAG: four helix bundle protein [Clostridia bacterium]|nr:four helix bundle protein [Clostridia bacterium]